MQFRFRYLVITGVVFAVLVLIETQLDSGFIRYSVGDALAAVLLYSILMAFSPWSRILCAGVSLTIAFAIEASQALNLIDRLGITPNRFTDVVFGNTFTWGDLLAYTAGIAITLVVEALLRSRTVD